MIFNQDQTIKGILASLTSPAYKIKYGNIQVARQMQQILHQDSKQPQIKKNQTKVYKFINLFYLLGYLKKSILIEECHHLPGDQKVITAIITAYQIHYISNFIQSLTWRGLYLQKLVELLKKIKGDLCNQLKKSQISISDCQNLYSMNKLMKQKQKQTQYYAIYRRLAEQVSQKKWRNQITKSIAKLFQGMIDQIYIRLGYLNCPNMALKLKFNVLKLIVIYIRCLNLLDNNQIQQKTFESKIYAAYMQKGSQILTRYFQQLKKSSLELIQIDKRYCKNLKNLQPIMQRNNDSQESQYIIINQNKQK